MITLQLLTAKDRIKSSDFCRPLFMSLPEGMAAHNLRWRKVNRIFGRPWFGKTVGAVNNTHLYRYEFVRGRLPRDHQTTATEES